jgi:dienelactone hydrolase
MRPNSERLLLESSRAVRRMHCLKRVLACVTMLGLTAPTVAVAAGDQRTSSVVAESTPPAGTEGLAVKWKTVTVPNLGVMVIAIARPSGKGPFPAVLVLHGTHGFAQEYVRLAQGLARQGRLGVAACWFSGGGGAGARFVTPIVGCADAPAMSAATSDLATQTVDALVSAVRALPDAQPGPIALFGHSRGGGAALNYVLKGGEARALILDNTGYPAEVTARVAKIDVPVLVLHGATNSADEGGSALSTVEMARSFESAMQRFGKPVTAIYYEGSGHNGMFKDHGQFDDVVRRTAAFAAQ